MQLVNIHVPLADHQQSLQAYTLHLSEMSVSNLNAQDPTSTLDSPTSPCTSLSSFPWSDSEPSPTPCQEHLDDAATVVPSLDLLPPPPITQTAPPARAQQLSKAPGPRRPSIATAALDSTPRDIVGRRAPKQRRITRAVQPLACYFCRGRKIACGPPANLGSGDRTCEYVVTRSLPSPHRKTLLVTVFFSLRSTRTHIHK
jgi:hypothetical protein